MLPAISLLAVSSLFSAPPQRELTLQQVLKANTAAINAIHSRHVTIEVLSNYPGPGEKNPPTEARPYITIEWWKEGARERVRQNWRLLGRKNSNLDASNGPKGYKALHGYDPDNQPPPSESDGGHCGGELDKTQSDDALGGNVRAYSYMQQSGRTLEELVAEHAESKLAATPKTSKLGCYEITLVEKMPTTPGSNLKDENIRDLRIFVDPKVGFWIRRIERGPSQTSTNPRDKGTFIGEVQEFKDCGNGIFWPLRIYQRTRWPGEPIGLDTFIRHTLHSINEPLSEEDFDVHFPDWLVVNDRISGQVFIWGPADKPRITFPSTAEFIEWDRPRVEAAAGIGGAPQRTRWMWLAGISILVGLMLAFILWRRSKIAVPDRMVPGSLEITSPPSELEER